MDKENKDIVTANEASYDPDAAELLEDLDDDDDDYEPGLSPSLGSSQTNRSIVNILASSSNLESLTTIPSMPAVSMYSSPASSLSSPSDLSSSSPNASESEPEAEETSEDAASAEAQEAVQPESEMDEPDSGESEAIEEPVAQPESPSDVPTDNEATSESAPVAEASAADAKSEAATAYPVPEQAKTEVHAEGKTKTEEKPTDSIPPAPQPSRKSIKPFDNKPSKKAAAQHAEEPPAPKEEPLPEKSERVEKAEDADASHDKSHAPSSKRPPVPPRMPAATMIPNGRVLREGEVAYTQEALNDILPGGKNDEARDLAAMKFQDNKWYTQVFNDDYFRTIPKSSPRQTKREAKFIIERLGIESGARVLDLCCGFGRHTLELATRGFDMVGMDLSMVMLKKALADAQAKNQAIKFVHGDMRKLSFKAIFDAIYNVQTSFGYFDDLSNFKVLQGIFNAIKPGGVFLIETVNRDFLVNDLPLRLWWKGQGCMLLEEIDLEQITGVLKVQRSFVFDDSSRAPWEQKIQIRLYSATEMRALLMRAGFKVVELSGDYSLPGAYFGATSPRNIFVAEKPIK